MYYFYPMNLEEAFKQLIGDWGDLPADFKNKYRSEKSKFLSGKDFVGEKKMRKMLIEAGFQEEWKKY